MLDAHAMPPAPLRFTIRHDAAYAHADDITIAADDAAYFMIAIFA